MKKATDALVRSAQQASENFQTYEDTSNVNINQRMVGGLAQVCIYIRLWEYFIFKNSPFNKDWQTIGILSFDKN